MSSARHPLPTDIVALVSFDGDVYHNEARPFDRLVERGDVHPLENALEQWFSFATGKHTWVSVRGATIRGLISARQRAKKSAWEVEVIINTTDDESVTETLLAQMIGGVGKQGAERVFLRVTEDSRLKQATLNAGFFAYAPETLYLRRAAPSPAEPAVALRKKKRADSHALFQLYSRETPANVRAIEGATLREWQAAQEKWGGRYTDYVAEGGDGQIDGWLRVMAGDATRISVLSMGLYDELVRAGLSLLPEEDVYCLAPGHLPGLGSALEDNGFEPVAAYSVLASRLTQPVQELAPERSNEAIPAS